MLNAIVSPKKPGRFHKKIDLFFVVILVLISNLIAIYAFKEEYWKWTRNQTPLSGDGLLFFHFLQIINDSSFMEILQQRNSTDNFGYPGGLNLSIYPIGNTFDILLLKLLNCSHLFSNLENVFHFYVIIRFSVIAVCSYFFFRVMKNNFIISSCASIIFTFIPYNLIRSEGHFVLGSTWSIPLGLGLAYLIAKHQLPFSVKSAPDQISLTKKTYILTWIGLFICGWNNFYYAVFSILIITFTITVLNLMYTPKIKMGILTKIIKSNFIVVNPIVIGFLLQILPNLLNRREVGFIYDLSKRSPIESIVYSGSLSSLTFDFHQFILKFLNREDLVEFLRSRTTWEGTQSGIVTGFLVYFILIFYILRLLKVRKVEPINKVNLETSYLVSLTAACFALYVSSPINFTFSLVTDSVRAWGRFTPYIALLLLSLSLQVIGKSTYSGLISTFLIVLMTFAIMDIRTFREGRAPASILNEIASDKISNARRITSSINLNRNCVIVSVPYYPFPEFDIPTDKAQDYDQLQIPRLFSPEIAWTTGGIKGTVPNYWLQNLQSEVPPFNRVSLVNQIAYGIQINPCVIAIHLNQLTLSEKKEVKSLRSKFPEESYCVRTLNKDFNVVFVITSYKQCLDTLMDSLNRRTINEASNRFNGIKSNSIYYRNVTPNSYRYDEFDLWYPGTQTSQRLEIIKVQDSKNIKTYAQAKFKNLIADAPPIEVCFNLKLNEIEKVCKKIKQKQDTATITFQIPFFGVKEYKRGVLDVTLTSNTDNQFLWTLNLINSKN